MSTEPEQTYANFGKKTFPFCISKGEMRGISIQLFGFGCFFKQF